MKPKNDLPPSVVQELLEYDQATGVVRWRKRDRKWFRSDMSCNGWNARFAGKKAGHTSSKGYYETHIFRRSYKVHRLAWVLAHGAWPSAEIDHINMVKTDNRLCNLRDATDSDQQQNKAKRANTSSRFVGVCWHKGSHRWKAVIVVKKKHINLGTFQNEEDAARAYVNAKLRYHHFHPIARN